MYRASARDDRVQLLKPLVKPGNALLTNCGVSTVDRIYPVKPDPHRKPDVVIVKQEKPVGRIPVQKELRITSIHAGEATGITKRQFQLSEIQKRC